jgi:hypothetical protein
MFTFKIIHDEPKSEDVFLRMREFLGKEYDLLVDQVEKGEGILVPLLALYCPISDEDEIRFCCADRVICCPVSTVNKFWFVYRKGMSHNKLVNSFAMANFSAGDYSFWEACEEESHNESGQSKLIVSALYPLLGDCQRVNILYIGSASENTTYAGRTCDVLIDFLGNTGRTGSIVMYDPFERTLDFEYSGFQVSMRGRKYDYDNPDPVSCNGERFTHVYDDVWVPTFTTPFHDDFVYDQVRTSLVEGTSKFAYRVVGSKVKTLFLKAGLMNHKELEGGIAGGTLEKHGPDIIVSGSSTRLGPYREEYVAAALKGYNVTFVKRGYKRGRLTFDPGSNLFKAYPDARISTKYYGEDLPLESYQVRDQLFYDGHEQRIIVNCPKFLPSGYYGCGCKCCVEIDTLVTNFVTYNRTCASDYLLAMLGTIVDDRCLRTRGVKFSRVAGYWITAARLYGEYEATISAIVKKYNVTFDYAERAFRYNQKMGRVGIRGIPNIAHPYNDYTVVVPENPPRWYRPNKIGEDYIVRGKKIVHYDRNGNDITKASRQGTLAYRPKCVEKERDEAAKYFAWKYRALLLSIDGYDFPCEGMMPCGFTTEFYYALLKDPGDLWPIEEYHGWFFVRTQI